MGGTADVIVIGAGIAGASVAGLLDGHADVLLLEAEDRPGYHTTGRSAATWIKYYGPPQVRALTVASRPFLDSPPDGFADAPLLRPRGELLVASPGHETALAEEKAGAPGLQQVTPKEIGEISPAMKTELLIGGLYDPDGQDIDVDLLHQGFLRMHRRAGGGLICDARVDKIERQGGVWTVTANGETYSAPVLVNAAGAWGDAVASMAGAAPVGLVPKKRTAALAEIANDVDFSAWPITADIGMEYYFKPESGKLLVSPADETPWEPCDAFAEDLDVAIGIDRMQQATDLEVTRVEHSWAGLRTFAPDGTVVNGFDPDLDGFYWLVGQGGYGIQTAPAMAQFAAASIRGTTPPADLAASGVDEAAIAPDRFSRAL